MKFMKLGSKPDTFYTAEAVRSVSSEVSSDLVVQLKGYRYLLHKVILMSRFLGKIQFPLLSKSAYLQRLSSEAPEPHPQLVHLPEFPGGREAFELCVKFCYGIKVTLSAHNIVAARCAAEFLQMTEEVEHGNLTHKLDVFFNSCVLNGWRDAMVALQSTQEIPTLSEELGITKKCVDAISARILSHPLNPNTPHGKGRSDGTNKAWWSEELSDLSMELYRRVMMGIKSSEKIPASLIGQALKLYASKWLPSISKRGGADRNINLHLMKSSKQKLVLESIISLLPTERGSASSRFLCKLLKAAYMLNASSSSKTELARRIAVQLEEAHAADLLIPNPPQDSNMLYNVDIVMTILENFMLRDPSPPRRMAERRRSRSAENIQESRRSSSASHSSKLKVAKLVDSYLQQIANEANLPLSKFLALAESVPEFARPDHDALYKAIDAYLEAHPELGKSERKKLCGVLNCRRLSMEVSTHAAQNEKLPLRVVVQLLFLEHSRTITSSSQPAHLPDDLKTVLASNGHDPPKPLAPSTHCHPAEDEWSKTGLKAAKPAQPSTGEKLDGSGHIEDDEAAAADGFMKSCMLKNLCAIPARPKKILSRLWPVNSRVPNERS